MSLITLALLGALIGLPFGYALQRTRLCFNSAYRTALLEKDFSLLQMIALAILIQMVALYTFAQFNLGGMAVNVVPFFVVANSLGGFVFGLALTFAEGCSSTAWYRVGNGNLGALVTLIGFALGEWSVETWDPFAALRGSELITVPKTGGLFIRSLNAFAEPPTLPLTLNISPWIIILPLCLIATLWLWRKPASGYLAGWDWRTGGVILGLIGSAAWLVAWPTGWHYGIGVVGATGAWVRVWSQGPQVLNWGSFMVVAMPVGALIAAVQYREFKWQVPNRSTTARLAIAGGLMGASATFAGGCNIGHEFSGLPTLALSSITTTLFISLGAALGIYWRFKRQPQVKR